MSLTDEQLRVVELEGMLSQFLKWRARMPDAGFTEDSPRWDWWTEGAKIVGGFEHEPE